jgi:transcriptional regulator with XRE-family HTH domain
MAETIHIGRKIARIRELKGIKQETLALDLGVSQQTVSNIEKSEKIDDDVLDRIAKSLAVPAEAIKNFNEETVINIISSTLHDNAGSINNQCTLNFNPIDKWLDAIEENKRLYNEKIELLERLLRSELEKIELIKGKQK